MIPAHILLIALAIINSFTFFVIANDKRKSMQSGAERTPEGILFFLAAAFGSSGIYLGMFAFRHKTRKWYFQVGIPLLVFQNLITIHLISNSKLIDTVKTLVF